jgi:hypothetical protein
MTVARYRCANQSVTMYISAGYSPASAAPSRKRMT